jgi:hypothetical protein
MMSAALVMAVGGEQTKTRAATSDRVESGEMTFAQSFGERVDLSPDVQTMNSTPGLMKNSNVLPPPASAGAKANGSLDQTIIEENETKSVTATMASGKGRNVAVKTNLIAVANASNGGESKTTPRLPPVDRGVLQQSIVAKIVAQTGVSQTTIMTAAAAIRRELPAGNVERPAETSSSVSEGAPLAASTNVDSVPGDSTAVAGRLSLLRDDVKPTVQDETVPAGKTVDVASAKRGAKIQDSAVGAKVASKTTGVTESAKTVGDPSIVTGVQRASFLPTEVVAQSDAQPNAISVTAANVSGIVGTIPGKFVSEAGADSTGRKTMAEAGKNQLVTIGQEANPAAAATVATGFGAEIDKAPAVTAAASKDADAKGLSAIGAAAAVHSATGNEAVISGGVPGIASKHSTPEVSGTKTQSGEGGAHAAIVQAGLGEQDGGGAVGADTGMSHRTLLATPTALEVGVSNGTQGWLKIRAEMTDGGVVNASLSSGSSAGQEMLHRELPALTAYLQEERVSVNTVVVPANAAAGTESRSAGGMDGEGGGQARQSGGQGGGGERQGSIYRTAADRADEIPTYMGLNGVGEDGLSSAKTYAGGGSWLNVRA